MCVCVCVCVCVYVCVLLTKLAGAFPLQLGFFQLTLTWAWQFKPHTRPTSTNLHLGLN